MAPWYNVLYIWLANKIPLVWAWQENIWGEISAKSIMQWPRVNKGVPKSECHTVGREKEMFLWRNEIYRNMWKSEWETHFKAPQSQASFHLSSKRLLLQALFQAPEIWKHFKPLTLKNASEGHLICCVICLASQQWFNNPLLMTTMQTWILDRGKRRGWDGEKKWIGRFDWMSGRIIWT